MPTRSYTLGLLKIGYKTLGTSGLWLSRRTFLEVLYMLGGKWMNDGVVEIGDGEGPVRVGEGNGVEVGRFFVELR